MRTHRLATLGVSALCLGLTGASAAAQSGQATASKTGTHVVITPDQLKWGPPPPALPPGAQVAVLDGDPAQAGVPFAIRIKFPDGYKVAPHWHPTDENVVVLSGTFMVGLGDKMDIAAMHTMAAGSYTKMPQRTNHYAMAKGETVIQLYGVGPFQVTYVNPDDDPRKKSASQ